MAVNEDSASHLYDFQGDYTSTLDLSTTTSNHPVWTSASNAIWWSEDHWWIGELSNMGTTEAGIVSVQNSTCPHNFTTSSGETIGSVTWQYQSATGTWTDAETFGIFTLPGNEVLFKIF